MSFPNPKHYIDEDRQMDYEKFDKDVALFEEAKLLDKENSKG